MFDSKLETRPYQIPAIQSVKEQLETMTTAADRTDITWNRDERNDIDYRGYKRYLYQFGNPDAQDKEISHAIISAATMDEAIQLFVDQIRGPDWYEGAVISVEVIGIDLRKDGSDRWLTEY